MILVIIPAYNEEKTIGAVVAGVKKYLPSDAVLVVDDGSRERTSWEARRVGAEIIRHPVNLGYGQALASGYLYALKFNFSAIVQLDGDGQHDPAYIPALVRELESADVVIGSRFLEGPGYSIPFFRKYGMRIFSALASRKSGLRLTDTTSGFRAMNRKAIEFCLGPSYDADALVKMHRAGLKIKEVPVKMRASSGRSMHGRFGSIFYAMRMLKSLGRG